MSDERGVKGLHPFDPRVTGIATRVVDPLRFCPSCGSDAHVESSEADTVTFTDTRETVRAAVCTRCKVMWSERSPSGKEVRADIGGGSKGRTISLPGNPTRPITDPRLDPRAVALGGRDDPRIAARKVELRKDIAYYERCRNTVHVTCRCHEIERKWNKLWDA